MSPYTRIGAVTAALLLGLGVTAPAHAARYVHRDAAYDVQSETCTSETECTQTVVTTAEGDVRRTAIRHTRDKVVVRTTFRKLSRTSDERLFVGRIVTNEGLKRDAVMYFEPGAGRGTAMLLRPNGALARCTVSGRVDYGNDVLVLSVPRRCLSAPRWVRVGVGYARYQDGGVEFADDALIKAGVRDQPVLSPRIRRA